MTEMSSYLLIRYREQCPDLSIPCAPFEAFDLLSDKLRLMDLAREVGVPIPRTWVVKGPEELLSVGSRLEFPMVIKPYRSRIPCNGRWIAASVHYARSFKELEERVAHIHYLNSYPFLIQQYIEGEGRGVFTLYNQGESITFFAHRRLREKPPSGGVSVLSESVGLDPQLVQYVRRILDPLKWHGVAMVEFKVARDGTPYLMEVNPRFWGSLQLAIDAGVDFPYLLYQLAIGEKPDSIRDYKVGIKTRWLLGDLDHLYLTFKNHFGPSGVVFRKGQTLFEFLKFFQRNTRYEVNRWDDLKPFLFELRQYLRSGARDRGSATLPQEASDPRSPTADP
jgi:predicted ATP-grasp superfamily ATP-dependent carboligase